MSSAFIRSVLGKPAPAITLPSTSGTVDLGELCARKATLFIYPATGVPGRAPASDPAPGWDDIPGAAGCTLQCLGFKSAHEAFTARGISVAGLSSQPLAEQEDFAQRHGLAFPLVCDAEFALGANLSLPTFTVATRTFYKRVVLYFEGNTIVNAIDDLPLPGESATAMLALLLNQELPRIGE